MRIMQPANRGLESMACRTPWHFRAAGMSGLLLASPVDVQEAHEYNRAIQVCNMDFYWTLVTSSYCVSYRRLAINSIVALMYFRLHIHKLRCSIISTALVSETTNIISCDAPTPKLWFSLLTFITYLGQLQFETSSGYPGNCNRVAG